MARQYRKDNKEWKKGFGIILKAFFDSFEIKYSDYADDHFISSSTVRYWFNGRCLPQKQYFQELKHYMKEEVRTTYDQDNAFHRALLNYFRGIHDEESYYSLVRQNPVCVRLAVSALEELYVLAKNGDRLAGLQEMYKPTGHTQIVVFDFDGTLAIGKSNQTTWETIWVSLGYTRDDCRKLHHEFDEGHITHPEWCRLTEEKFKARNMHRDILDQIAKKIHLIKGVRSTLKELRRRDIAVYIASGSILTVIQNVLGSVEQYVQEIQANVFKFDQAGFLTEIVGTQFDFQGKAKYISILSERHRISPRDILFVGNSINDRFAYLSGCRTLCINPQLVDTTNKEVFNYCIPCLENLKEVLPYIE